MFRAVTIIKKLFDKHVPLKTFDTHSIEIEKSTEVLRTGTIYWKVYSYNFDEVNICHTEHTIFFTGGGTGYSFHDVVKVNSVTILDKRDS